MGVNYTLVYQMLDSAISVFKSDPNLLSVKVSLSAVDPEGARRHQPAADRRTRVRTQPGYGYIYIYHL